MLRTTHNKWQMNLNLQGNRMMRYIVLSSMKLEPLVTVSDVSPSLWYTCQTKSLLKINHEQNWQLHSRRMFHETALAVSEVHIHFFFGCHAWHQAPVSTSRTVTAASAVPPWSLMKAWHQYPAQDKNWHTIDRFSAGFRISVMSISFRLGGRLSPLDLFLDLSAVSIPDWALIVWSRS
jgi:hypothetical protein